MSNLDRRDFVKIVSWTAAGLAACRPLRSWGAGMPPLVGDAGHFQQLPIANVAAAFASPPDDARPWVYWFWLRGNVTKEGVTADLEAMQRVGIGGVLIMEVDQGTPAPPCVQGATPLPFMSTSWQEMFKFVNSEAHRLGLEVNMTNDAGWCGSGGPWITPELSMQELVWTETYAKGGQKIDQILAQPPTVANYYRDIAVLAFPTPAGENPVTVTASSFQPAYPPRNVTDGNAATFWVSNGWNPGQGPTPDKPEWLCFEFGKPFHTDRLQLTPRAGYGPRQIKVQSSSDGRQWKTLASATLANGPTTTLSFPPTTARYFRILILSSYENENVQICEASFNARAASERARSGTEGIADITALAEFTVQDNLPTNPSWPKMPAGQCVALGKIVDISTHLDAHGRLLWAAPPGPWTIVRLGHTSTGVMNHPAPSSGLGLESDKLSRRATDTQFYSQMGKLAKDVGPLAGKTLVSTHIDSWETGSQNWTPTFRKDFQRLRGYDLLPYLPAVTGQVVESLEITQRFLWDFRKTISDLLVENYAGRMRDLAARHGLRLSIEGYSGVPANELDYGGQAVEPMGELWSWPQFGVWDKVIEMASAGHTFGHRIIGQETFTADADEKWRGHPAIVKNIGDWAFCQGINRFVIHRYAMQPWVNPHDAPGMSMGPWGLHYERTETWWEQSKPWHEYLTRCQYLLRQGHFVADICYMQPEGAPAGMVMPPMAAGNPPYRPGYNFDGCSAEVVLTRMRAKNGRLVLPDGTSYRVLVLPPVQTMTPTLLRKLKELIDGGATIVGPRPEKSPSLTNFPHCDAEVRKLAAELWDSGKIMADRTAEQVLAAAGLPPDFTADKPLNYCHRRTADADLYFVANHEPWPVEAVCTFRVKGKEPELWNPETGAIETAPLWRQVHHGTQMSLSLPWKGSLFVVFRQFRHGGAGAGGLMRVSRDGQAVLCVPALRPDIVVQHAVYGVLGDPKRTRNVTAIVAGLARKGKLSFPVVAIAALGGDPAYGIVKTLRVEYAYNGHSITATACDGEIFSFQAFRAPLPVVVQHAVYGVLGDPDRTRDATAVVRKLAQKGQWHFPVADITAAIGDPALGIVKTLRVAYLWKGHPQVASAQDGGEIILHYPTATFPPLLVHAGAPGKYQALIFQSGQYQFTGASGKTAGVAVPALPGPREIPGPWVIDFPAGWGAPPQIRLDHLISWSEHPDSGVRYFSGTAIYRKTLTLPPGLVTPQRRVYLDLGEVQVMAEVILNGQTLGVLWKPPFRVEVTDVIHAGHNSLEIHVTNLWINRLIGDQHLPEDPERNANGTLNAWPKWLLEGQPNPSGRYTFTTWQLWHKNDPLVCSGLIGPVRLVVAERVVVPI